MTKKIKSTKLFLSAALLALVLTAGGIHHAIAGCIGVQSCSHPPCDPTSWFRPEGFEVYDRYNREDTSISNGEYRKTGNWNARKYTTLSWSGPKCQDPVAWFCAQVHVNEDCTYHGGGGQ